MTTTADGKKAGAAARAEAADDDKFTSQDTFENPSLKLLANTATVEDGYGIERIVGFGGSSFTPAPTEATEEQKKAMADFEGKLNEAKTERTKLLQGGGDSKVESLSDVPETERADNVQAVGGTSVDLPNSDDPAQQQQEGTGDKNKSQGSGDKKQEGSK